MRHFILLCFLLSTLAAFAQEVEKPKDKNQERMDQFLKKIGGEKPKEESRPQVSREEGPILFTDTVRRTIEAKSFPNISNYYSECYAKAVKQYGFWKGVGPKLSENDIRHMWRYVKLSRPAGQPSTAPFTHMQVLNPFGKLTNNSYGPILANPFGSDEGISISWKWKLMDICQFEIIYREGVVVQENMYDESGKLVLQYFPTSVSRNQIMGHYTDAYGTLAKLRKDEECTYVGITLDENGYESKISFMDTDGHLKRNGDDAFFQLLTCDEQGNNIQVMSADAVGNPIIDNWGNCGWQYTYDGMGHVLTATCINQFGIPQRMSKQRDKDTEDCVRIRYTYDRWGNVLTKTFYDENWNPDTITGGIHRYEYTKTLYGNTTSLRAEGLDKRLVPSLSTWRQVLDNQGHCLYYVERDANGLLWRSGRCIQMARYKDGTKIWEEKYTSPNGVDSVLSYRYVRTPKCDSIYNFEDEYINIEHYDNRRRLVSDEFYDFEMRPIQRLNYHKKTVTYSEDRGISIEDVRYTDEKGLPCEIADGHWRKYNRNTITRDRIHKTYQDFEYDGNQLVSTTEVDSIKRQRIITKYKDGHVIDKYGHDLSEDCENSVGLLYFDSLGYRGRTFRSDALYYKARKFTNIQGNNVAWQGINEFGEPSYILNGDWENASLYCTNVIGDEYYYDEKGDTIPRYSTEKKKFKDSLHKSFCIELIDSVAVKYGLRTGDLIVRYGDWHYPQPSTYGRSHESFLCLETVRKATKEKKMIVMRHDGLEGTSRLIELALPAGTPKELGFIYHMLYMTEKEKKRYERTVEHDLQHVQLDSINTYISGNSQVRFFTPYKVGDDSDKELFTKGLQENVIVIAWEPHVDGKSYLLPCNNDLISHFWGHELDSVTIHYTVDGENVQHRVLSKKEAEEGGRYSISYVEDVSDFSALADSLQKAFYQQHPIEKIVLKPHEAAKRLLQMPGATSEQTDGSQYRGTGEDKYSNVNSCFKVLIDYDSLSYDEMVMAHEIIKNIDFSDYCFLRNENDYGYFLYSKGRFTECAWTTSNGIVFLSDSVDFYNKMLIVAEVVDSGLFSQHGLEGKYVILKCNDWTIGMDTNKLTDIINTGKSRTFVMAKMEGEEGNYILGNKVKIKIPEGEMGIYLSWMYVPDKTFYDAYLHSKRFKKKKY